MKANKIIGIVFGLLLVAAGCQSSARGGVAAQQSQSQGVTAQYQASATAAVPYPVAQMAAGGWLERSLLKENLLRQNDKNRIAYVTLLSAQGQPIVQYVIQGMVFDLNSQMTTTDNVLSLGCRNDCGAGAGAVVASPGDNGTYGPEPHAIGFFTTEGVEIKWNGLYLESDSPQVLTTKPLIVYDASSAKPSVTGGGITSTQTGGIKVVPGTVPTTLAPKP